ncbi:MAG: VCBS repeat-containing protein [Planctomycetes bacterium]|nr:VCBS repeat-containing protein [Planctomycetota bacterium]
MAANRRTTLTLLGAIAIAIGVVLIVNQNGQDEPRPSLGTAELLQLLAAWNRGNDAFDHFDFTLAENEFSAVAEKLPGEPDVWVNIGIAAMNQDNDDAFHRAHVVFKKAIAIDPDHVYANHCTGILMKHMGNFERSEACFRKVIAIDPHDPTACYYLGTLMLGKNEAEAEELFQKAIASEPHQQSAIYQLFGLYYSQDKEQQAASLVALFKELEASGAGNKAGIVYSEMGHYGSGIRPFPRPLRPDGDRSGGVTYSVKDLLGNSLAPATRAHLPWVSWKDETSPAELIKEQFAPAFAGGVAIADVDDDGDLDVWSADGQGAGQLYLNTDGTFAPAPPSWGVAGGPPSISACFGDYDNDGRPDLYVCCAGPNKLYKNIDGNRFEDVTKTTGTSGGDVFTAQAVMADLDADGDVDIYCANLAAMDEVSDGKPRWPSDATPANNCLFSNDRTGTFTDIAERTGTAGPHLSRGVIATDLDGDRDADLVVLGGLYQPLIAYRNDRIWRFTEQTDAAGLSNVLAEGMTASDIDGDGQPDLMVWGGQPGIYTNLGHFHFVKTEPLGHLPGCVLDADNDGDKDLLSLDSLKLKTPEGWRDEAVPSSLHPFKDVRSIVAADIDGDGVLDAVVGRAGNVPAIMHATLAHDDHNWIEIGLKGVREVGKMRANTGGIGARVTVISGPLQQWQEMVTSAGSLGCPPASLHFGLGTRSQVDYVSVSWPDDLLQGESKISANTKKVLTQVYRKSSSCPLLFAWDGQRMAFVTDFLGVGGLGFFVRPGVYASPDPTELVWIPSLEPKDGQWTLSIHEGMEEICYLDEAKLMVVDHADGFIVLPDERLAIDGPSPDGRLIAFRPDEAIYPKGLSTLEGDADPALMRHADRAYQPGVKPDNRFVGFAAPQEIVLDFGDALAATKGNDLILFLEGWVEYPYSHVNFAAWQAGLTFGALSLDRREAQGGWRAIHENFGYPAGMPRVMTLDVSDLPREGDCVLRLRTNQELYIDRAWLAADHGTEGLSVTELSANAAELRTSGYPREYSPDGHQPLLYDYALMDPAIDYKTMAGAYTRFGDVRELLDSPDDRYVIFGRAEEVILRFRALEPLTDGRRRSFILKSDGFCKDMDLYTAHPRTVGPLPFHGMTGYPYPPSEAYPSSPAHDAYHRTYNTRTLSR